MKYSTKEALYKFNMCHKKLKYDAILCCHPHMFQVAKYLKKSNNWTCPIILREHNIEYDLVYGYANSLSGFKKIAALLLAKITKREELNIWNEADGVAFLTSTDFKTASDYNNSKTFFIAPEGIPISEKQLDTNIDRNNDLLILLNKKATQSVLNVSHFLNTVWRHAYSLKEFSEISIIITGITSDELSIACSISREELAELKVKCVGFVESLDEVFATSLALISPTYVGGGIRKKILEAMANFLPVIASPLDVRSTNYFEGGINILEFDNVNELKKAILLLSDKSFSNHLSISARATVEAHANWDVFAKKIIDYVN